MSLPTDLREGEVKCQSIPTKSGCVLRKFFAANGSLVRVTLADPTEADMARAYLIMQELDGKASN